MKSLKKSSSSMSFTKNTQGTNVKRCIAAVWIIITSIIVVHMGLGTLSRALREAARKEEENGGTVGQADRLTLGSRADWGDAKPEFCKKIIEDPKPFHRDCHRDSGNMTCRGLGGETLMFSQFQQDYYLYTRHFSKLKRAGVYLDIATNDPVSISNTYFMDRCLGWRGICVEANPSYYEKIHRLRSCDLVPTCVGKRDGEVVELALEGGAGGILGSTYKHKHKWTRENMSVPRLVERCTTVRKILDRGNVRVVDFLSLDVEGHEVEVLRGVDWERTKILVMSVEVTGGVMDELQVLMDKLGYKRHWPDLDEKTRKTGRLTEDVVYLHPDVEFGAPV